MNTSITYLYVIGDTTAKKKIGHTGTLDPMAKGVLPLLIGKGTQVSKYLINHDKVYKVELELGKRTDTADSEGKIIEEKEVDKAFLQKEKLEEVLSTFIGKQEQIPPIYSAIKVNGKKLYEYARKGQEVEIKPREIEVYDIKLDDIKKLENKIEFTVKCSKGTYIRSLCEDIAKKIGTIGYMSGLERLQVGEFKIEDSIKIEDLQENVNDKEFFEKHFITLEELFNDSEKIILNGRKLELFLNGVKITQNFGNGIYKIYNEKSIFIGIGTIEKNLLKRDIIL